MAPRKPKKVTTPNFPDMIEVNNYNRKKLGKKYGIDVPDDVTFIIPPETLLDVAFWNLPVNGHGADLTDEEKEILALAEEEAWRLAEENSRKRHSG